MGPSPISTDVFPGDEMSPEAIGGAASRLRFIGDQVGTDSADVVTTWGAMAQHYVAPESGELLAAMNPVKTSGATFDANLGFAADALVTFADEVRTIKKTLEGIRTEANMLLAQIGRSNAAGEQEWFHDPVLLHKNEALQAAVAAQAQLLKAAEQKCAAAIESLAGGGRRGENGGPGFASAPYVSEEAPWGHVLSPVELGVLQDEGMPSWEKGGSAAAFKIVGGLLYVAGFDNGNVLDGWSIDNTADAVKGMVLAQGNPMAWLAMGKDFIAYGDWGDPGYALGEVVVNVASLGVGAAKIGSFGRLGAASREAVEAAGAGKVVAEAGQAGVVARNAARLAEIGQRLAGKVVVPTMDGLKHLAASARVGGGWAKTLDRLGDHLKALHHDIDVDRASTKAPAEPGSAHGGRDVSSTARGSEPASVGSDGTPTARSGHPAAGDTSTSDHGSGEPRSDGQYRYPDVNLPDVDPTEHVLHERDHFVSPQHPGAAETRAHARRLLQAEHLEALHVRDALADQLKVSRKEMSVDDWPATRETLDLSAPSPQALHEIDLLDQAVAKEYQSGRALHKASEDMGTYAAHEFLESRQETIIVGAKVEPGVRDHLDTVGINSDHTVLDVVEQKGAGAGLGKRNVAGVWVQQGSSSYLNKLLHLDPDILRYFSEHPEDVQRLIDGDMELQHHVLYAKANGSVVVERVKLNPEVLHLGDLLPRGVSVGG